MGEIDIRQYIDIAVKLCYDAFGDCFNMKKLTAVTPAMPTKNVTTKKPAGSVKFPAMIALMAALALCPVMKAHAGAQPPQDQKNNLEKALAGNTKGWTLKSIEQAIEKYKARFEITLFVKAQAQNEIEEILKLAKMAHLTDIIPQLEAELAFVTSLNEPLGELLNTAETLGVMRRAILEDDATQENLNDFALWLPSIENEVVGACLQIQDAATASAQRATTIIDTKLQQILPSPKTELNDLSPTV